MIAHQELNGWWLSTATVIKTEEVSQHRLLELERRYDVVLPDDFRKYLRMSSPMEDDAWDSENTNWWAFGNIKNIREDFSGEVEPFLSQQADKYLLFADYAIWCWAWAICCGAGPDRGKVALVAGRGYDKIVADSFSDFVHAYVSDFKSVC